MKKNLIFLSTCALSILPCATSTFASVVTTISVNWRKGNWYNEQIPSGNNYGVEPVMNWLNPVSILSDVNLTDSNSQSTTVDYAITAANNTSPIVFSIYDTNPGAIVNTPMRAGFSAVDSNFNGRPLITLSDLSGTFTSYDLIVYVTGTAGSEGRVVLSGAGSSSYYFAVPTTYTSDLILSTDQSSSNGINTGTYVRFNGLTADVAVLTLQAVDTDGGTLVDDVAIGGIQITGVPEPTTYALFAGLSTLGLVLMRRRRK